MRVLVVMFFLAAPAAAEPVSAPEMYGLVHDFGRKIRATTFAHPEHMAFAVDTQDCLITVYDEDQVFSVKGGRLQGENLMCQVITLRGGRQIDYIDGCDGQNPLASAGEENSYPNVLRACSQRLLEAMMGAVWNSYVTSRAVESKGWKPGETETIDMVVDSNGKASTKPGKPVTPSAQAKRKLLAEASAYDRWFGRAALLKAITPLWAYGGSGKETAVALLKKAPWWRAKRAEED